MVNEVKNEVKTHPRRNILLAVLLTTLGLAFITALGQKNYMTMIVTVLISALILLPMMMGKWYKVDIPLSLEVYSVLFIYLTLFLGELNHYYTTYWWWDVLMHMSSGLAFGILGVIILYMLHKAEKVQTSPKTVAVFAFAFALAIGALWEVVEFIIDQIAGESLMQTGSFYWTSLSGGLVDTMKDLIDDSIGALFSAIMGYLFIKKQSGIVVKQVVKEFKKDNPRLFKKGRK